MIFENLKSPTRSGSLPTPTQLRTCKTRTIKVLRGRSCWTIWLITVPETSKICLVWTWISKNRPRPSTRAGQMWGTPSWFRILIRALSERLRRDKLKRFSKKFPRRRMQPCLSQRMPLKPLIYKEICLMEGASGLKRNCQLISKRALNREFMAWVIMIWVSFKISISRWQVEDRLRNQPRSITAGETMLVLWLPSKKLRLTTTRL